MGYRRMSREFALHVLYSIDVCKMEKDDAWHSFLSSYEGDDSDKILEFGKDLVDGVLQNLDDIDKNISASAKNWDIKRMASIDRNILRIASFELLFNPDTPSNVIINEAVEIAKKYSTDDSGKFVNGVLDTIKNKRGQDDSKSTSK
jgi:transcription antitermination protein NusB